MSNEPELKRFDQRVLASQINEMKINYGELHESYDVNIKQHTDRISERDLSEFREFLEAIKKENLERIKGFFSKKIETKGESFNYYDQDNLQQFQNLSNDRAQLHSDITNEFEIQKAKDERKLQLINQSLEVFEGQTKAKSFFNLWKSYHLKKKEKQKLYSYLDERLKDKQIQKTFFSWRNYAYKPAYEQKIVSASESDVVVFQQNYLDIINTLKQEIQKTEDQITIRTEQKAQLAYTMSKNLMKTISSLSNEVISLNQVAVQTKSQQQQDIAETQQYLSEMNSFISAKYNEIKSLKKTYADDGSSQNKDGRKVGVISFQNAPLQSVSLTRLD